MNERTRIVAYFDEGEKAAVEEAAQAQRISVSGYVASAALQQAAKDQKAAADAKVVPSRFQSLIELRGIGKEAFAALGGGEEFLRRERAEFTDAWDKREKASQQGRQSKR